MKWQKLFLFLTGSGVVLGCAIALWLRWASPAVGGALWPNGIVPHFPHWVALVFSPDELNPAIWWTLVAVLVVDLAYLVWLRSHRRLRANQPIDQSPLARRHSLSVPDYEALLRQYHDTLLARYHDPGLVQYLLNREAARVNAMKQRSAVDDGDYTGEERVAAPPPHQNEPETERPLQQQTFRMMINPIGA